MIITRYADDIVIGFERETDARRFLEMMRARFEAFVLTLHSEKTRLIEFGRFNFLGFTLICGTSRRGKFLLKRKTRRDRMQAKLRETKEELRRRRHLSIPEQGQWLRQVVFAYHAVPTNMQALA